MQLTRVVKVEHTPSRFRPLVFVLPLWGGNLRNAVKAISGPQLLLIREAGGFGLGTYPYEHASQ